MISWLWNILLNCPMFVLIRLVIITFAFLSTASFIQNGCSPRNQHPLAYKILTLQTVNTIKHVGIIVLYIQITSVLLLIARTRAFSASNITQLIFWLSKFDQKFTLLSISFLFFLNSFDYFSVFFFDALACPKSAKWLPKNADTVDWRSNLIT